MTTYRVYLETGASLSIEVEAEDEESAIEAAFEEAPADVCAQCSGWGQQWSFDLGEWDYKDSDDPRYPNVVKVEE